MQGIQAALDLQPRGWKHHLWNKSDSNSHCSAHFYSASEKWMSFICFTNKGTEAKCMFATCLKLPKQMVLEIGDKLHLGP